MVSVLFVSLRRILVGAVICEDTNEASINSVLKLIVQTSKHVCLVNLFFFFFISVIWVEPLALFKRLGYH